MMLRPSVDNLPPLSTTDRIRLLEGDYPNPRVWNHIDQRRAAILREVAASQPHGTRADMLDLACRLRFRGADTSATLASYSYALEQRLRLSGAFLRLAERVAWPVSFRIYPPGLEFPADELEAVEFDYICDCLRRTFDRVAGAGADGYVGAVARGEYNVVNDRYRLYFRGLAYGQLADSLRWINESDEYEFAPWADRYSPPFLRVSWRRIRRDNASAFLRLLPTEWQRIYEAPYERELVRQSVWSELPPRRMAELLLFWNRLNVRDITLLMRLRVAGDGLRLTAKGRGRSLSKHNATRKAAA